MTSEKLRRRRRSSRPRGTLAAAAALGLALLSPQGAAAQRLSELRLAPAAAAAVMIQPARLPTDSARWSVGHVAVVTTGALVGGAAGALVGGVLGFHAGNDPNCDGICGPLGAVLLGALLEPIGMGVGANVADRGRGSGALDVLGAAGALYLTVLAGRDRTALYVAVPLQLFTTVAIERATANRKKP